MNKIHGSKHYIDILAVLVVFLIFAICIVVSIFLGAKVYNANTQRDSSSYDRRTCTQYISNKVHSAPSPDSISVISIDSIPVLKIDDSEGNGKYSTFIYCYEGWIHEQYALSSKVPSLSAGEKLIKISNMYFEYNNGLINCSIVFCDNETSVLYLCTHSGEVAS